MNQRPEAHDVPCPRCCAAKGTPCIREGQARDETAQPHAERWERFREWVTARAPVVRRETTDAKREATGGQSDLISETLARLATRFELERDEAIRGLRAANEMISQLRGELTVARAMQHQEDANAARDRYIKMLDQTDQTSHGFDVAEAMRTTAWAFVLPYPFHEIQIRKSGPHGDRWFITRRASDRFDGAVLREDDTWSPPSNPRHFATAEEAFLHWRGSSF